MSAFRKSGFSIPKLFEATISLGSFWSEESRLNVVKSPIELLYGSARTLGFAGQEMDDHIWMLAFATELGQDLLNPPNVAGFPGGTAWVAGQMMEKRIEIVNRMFGEFSISSAGMQSAQKTTKMDAARSRGLQSRIKEVDTYRAERKQFFENLKKDQLGFETVFLNEVTRDFEKNRWRNIDAAFYNVQLNGRKWDGITVRFGNDKNDRGKLGDYLRVEQGKSSPDAFDQSAYNRSFTNNRGLRTVKFSYPSGGDQRRMPTATEDKLLVKRLSQAMQIVIDHNRAYTQLNSAAQKWLKQFLGKVGWKKLSENGQTYPPVRMFAIENGGIGGGSSGEPPYPKTYFVSESQISKSYDATIILLSYSN
jgi:DNA-binding protein H-NS